MKARGERYSGLYPGATNGSQSAGGAGPDLSLGSEHGDPERTYSLLTGHGLARRYVGGKSVLNLGWGGAGYWSRLLAETAERVVGLELSGAEPRTGSREHSAPNVTYGGLVPPELPYPGGHFDVTVALQVIENLEEPEEMLAEIKRTLGPEGILVLSTPDRGAGTTDPTSPARERELYPPELRALLERHFASVRLYRLRAVAGGVISEDSGGLEREEVETAESFSNAPAASLMIAVCGDSEVPVPDLPYLMLDGDRRIFGEYGDRVEDVNRLREEIEHLQETEVQAFQDSLRLRDDRLAQIAADGREVEARRRAIQAQNNALRARNKELEDRVRDLQSQGERPGERHQPIQHHAVTLRARNEKLERRLSEMERARTWRLLAPYRSLRLWLNAGRH
jgi:SAM-dependent methyltransferase